MNIGPNSLANLARIRKDIRSKRISSYDRTGANADFINVPAGQKYEICNIKGAGCIKHIWMTLNCPEKHFLRKIVLRMWWDNEDHPSVVCPLGDFFGVGHAETVNFWSLPLSMGPQAGRGFNCFFPMPFASNARLEVENENEQQLMFYFYIDYQEYEKLEENYGRFHVMWRRENPCKGDDYETARKIQKNYKKNPTHENDYLILDAQGEGHYVGCHIDIHNLFDMKLYDKRKLSARINWPGEGDDYIDIDDGEIKIYGTGTEDYFCTAFCPTKYFCTPYYGIPLPGGSQWSGKISYYRYHIEDPIYFRKNIKVKIEHGHANQRSDDYSSTAYWYQTEPHKQFTILPKEERIPRTEPKQRGGRKRQ